MQIHLESGTLNPSALVLRLPSGERQHQATRTPAVQPFTALRQARQEALRSHASEQRVWFGLALASLGVLIVSLWL